MKRIDWEKWNCWFFRIFHLHWATALALSVMIGAGLIWVFSNGWDQAWYAIPLYIVSAYVLTADCVSLIPQALSLKKRRQERERNKSQQARTRAFMRSLVQNMLVNLVYGGLQVAQGVWVGSGWIGANGLYSLCHGFAYLALVRCEQKLGRVTGEKERKLLAWRYYTWGGVALFAINVTMSGLAFQMIWMNRGSFYSEIMVIGVAAYTFYKLTIAIIRVAQCRKSNSPILGASRNFLLTEALMNLFFLQAALLNAFGQDDAQRFLMTSLTGFAICLMTMLGALGMVAHGRKKMKGIRED